MRVSPSGMKLTMSCHYGPIWEGETWLGDLFLVVPSWAVGGFWSLESSVASSFSVVGGTAAATTVAIPRCLGLDR